MGIRPATRRTVVTSTLAGFHAIVPARVLGEDTPGERRTTRLTRIGNDGTDWTRQCLRDDWIRVVAVCDVNREEGGYWNGTPPGCELARSIVYDHYEKTPTQGSRTSGNGLIGQTGSQRCSDSTLHGAS